MFNEKIMPVVDETMFETMLVGCTIYMIARDNTNEFKLHIAQVINNRIKTGYFSDGTVLGTIFYPYQFVCWSTSEDRMEMLQQFNQGFMDENKIVFDSVNAWHKAKSEKQQSEIIAFANVVDSKNLKEQNLVVSFEKENYVFYEKIKGGSK